MIALPPRPIRTERLVLEPSSVAHVPALAMQVRVSVDHLLPWMPFASEERFEGTLEYISAAETAWLQGTGYSFAIVEADTATVVGHIGLRRTFNHPLEGNIGYWVGAQAAGRGYMTEAAAAVVEFGFKTLGLLRVELRVHVDNRASQRVAEKVGMRREGRARGGTSLGARRAEDAYLYGMLATDPRRDTGRGNAARPAGVPVVTAPDFSRGLVTTVAQDAADGAVLMVAHMNEEAYGRTLSSGHAWFWSRSRERLWEKGESSGNHLVVESVTLDCDGDAVVLGVAPAGPACHTGARSCFHNPVVLTRSEPEVITRKGPRQPRGGKGQQ